jgi:hypothetical protein
MSQLLRLLPPRGRSGPWILALSIALIIAFQPMWADATAVGVVGAIGLTLVAAARWQLRWLPVVVLVACALALRLSVIDREASDVADVTRMAILSMIGGDNPYGVGYWASRPEGAAFPYGPVALLWYLPFRIDPANLELLVSMALTGYFGIRAANGRPIGLAIFALAPPLVLAAVDGSNDTSAGLFILAAIAVGARWPAAGAVVLAVAIAFKPYAVAFLPAFIAWAGLTSLVVFAVASVIAWAPVLFTWGVDSYLRSLAIAQSTHLREAYWSLAAVWQRILPGAAPRELETIRYFVAGGVAVLGALKVRSIDGVIVVGSLAFVIAQFGGYFGSYVYIAAIAPVLCWRVDDWLRMGLPELMRAYGTAPGIGRTPRRPVLAPAPTRPATAPGRVMGAVHGAVRGASRGRGAKPTRTPTG